MHEYKDFSDFLHTELIYRRDLILALGEPEKVTYFLRKNLKGILYLRWKVDRDTESTLGYFNANYFRNDLIDSIVKIDDVLYIVRDKFYLSLEVI
jgi:hypothetical protein